MIRLFETALDQEVAAFETKLAMWKWLRDNHVGEFYRLKYLPCHGVIAHAYDRESFKTVYTVRLA
jgi:hypothetical protein